jgi:2-polyprenyl-6-methoxyphenol hydroxylase-like FAD-dependent oxidoreductase
MDSTKDVIVIGGSLAGLMHALALKSFGRNIRVFEARSYDDLAAEAAGITLWPHAQKLITTYVPEVDLDQIAFQNHTMRIMTGDAVALTDAPITDDIRTTSWSVVYRLLRNACEKHGGDGGVVTFEMERPICTIKEQGETMVVTYKKDDGGEEEARASLVIAADGARSFARSQVLPGLKATYAGYLAWRGNFPEQEAPPELKSVLDGDLAMVKFEGSYILV